MLTLAKWSVNDYHRMIETGILSHRQVELLAGEIVEMASEGPLHRYTVTEAVKYLRSRLGDLAEIQEAHPITLSDSEPEPDLAIVHPPNARYKTRHPGAEEIFWLIEIADSTLDKDLGSKQKIYAQANIPEYWVMNVQQQQIIVLRDPQADTYQSQQRYTHGTIAAIAFPAIELSVDALLAR
jgi:Uma2 family endonuclease